MPISLAILRNCEDLIAENQSEAVVKKLLAAKDDTGYKADILALSARWLNLENERITSTLSAEELSRRERSFNRDALRLLSAIDRESRGETATTGILDTTRPIVERDFSFRSMTLTALLVAGVAAALVFAWQHQPPITCPNQLNLSGTWSIDVMFGDSSLRVGYVNITQDYCEADFVLSGQVAAGSGEGDVDFTARIGAIDKGELLFLYQNFGGERGECRGVTPSLTANTFAVHCTDLIGFDRDNRPNTRMVFSRK